MFLKKILRVVVDFDKAPRLHLVTVPKSRVVKRTSSVCCGVETTNASSRCRVGLLSCAAVMKPLYKQEMYTLKVNRNYKRVKSLSCWSAQLCCRDETTIQTGNVYTKGQ